jgi:hypothetical protein
MASPSPSAANTLERVVAAPYGSAQELLSRVLDWFSHGSPLGRVPFDEQPPLVKALWTLDALSTSLAVSGTTSFLLGMGSEARRVGEYARTVGAPITARFGDAMIQELKRLRRGRLPAETQGAMTDAIKSLESRDQAAGGAGLFLPLDDEFSAAVIAELDSALPHYVVANVADLAAAAATHERPAEQVIDPATPRADGQRCFSADFHDYDSRARDWIQRAGTLTPADFTEIARRYRKGVADKVNRKAMRVWTDGPRVGRTNDEWKPEFKATLKLSADIEDVITKRLQASGMEPSIQRKALAAYFSAAAAIKHLPELERLSWGPEVIEAALAPFEGFVPRWDAAW